MKKEINFPAAAKLCTTCKDEAYDVLLPMRDGSKFAVKLPAASLTNPHKLDVWWDTEVKFVIKDGIARIKHSDYWTKPSQVIDEEELHK
jgi:hypothetical protein